MLFRFLNTIFEYMINRMILVKFYTIRLVVFRNFFENVDVSTQIWNVTNIYIALPPSLLIGYNFSPAAANMLIKIIDLGNIGSYDGAKTLTNKCIRWCRKYLIAMKKLS